jgi:protein disulfide-isomerase A6
MISNVVAFYEEGSKVVKLTKDNFDELVLESDQLWLIEFYAPWCGHCKKLAPEYEKAAKALEGIVNIGAVDMTTDGEAGRPYEVSGYPTIKFFGTDKSSPLPYEGERKKNGIIDYLLERAKELALSRLGIQMKTPVANDDSNVVVLTDENFDDVVLNSLEPWFVEFYAPWCGHCKKLTPHWNKLATKV